MVAAGKNRFWDKMSLKHFRMDMCNFILRKCTLSHNFILVLFRKYPIMFSQHLQRVFFFSFLTVFWTKLRLFCQCSWELMGLLRDFCSYLHTLIGCWCVFNVLNRILKENRLCQVLRTHSNPQILIFQSGVRQK